MDFFHSLQKTFSCQNVWVEKNILSLITTRVSLVCTMYAYVCTSQCIPTQHKGGDKGRFALWSFWSTKLKGDKGCLIF